jgi:hypothetical protein
MTKWRKVHLSTREEAHRHYANQGGYFWMFTFKESIYIKKKGTVKKGAANPVL